MDALKGQRVGILDDNADSRGVLRCWLETEGFDVHEYSRKDDFVRAVRQNHLDVGLVDLWLPEGSGFDVPFQVRNGMSGIIPILAVTADAMPGVLEEARNAGFSGFLTKPVDLDQLSEEIRRHLK